jgi:hypothetical protein
MLEWMDLIIALAVGVVLRFGVPLGLTGLLIWWLRRLDIRWQAEAQEMRRVQLEHAVAAQPPCWETRNCPAELRAVCPVYGRQDVPCWQMKRTLAGRLPEACLDCDVFRNAPVPKPASV